MNSEDYSSSKGLPMAIDLDHIFILTHPGAALADSVADVGLIEGSCNTHPGQGTANRRFFFANTTLEFLYVRDAMEAENGPGSRLRFVERAASLNASPFGLIVRSANETEADIHFPGWKYYPDYFNGQYRFHVGENSDKFEEPLCICMPINLPQRKKMPKPENPDWVLTELRIAVPVSEPSETLVEIANCDGVSIRLNKPHRMELVFNEGRAGMLKDFSPELPMAISW
ncbi:hypothetical protein ACFL2V_06580 [Pseudomonadota bacterium]